jgi:hypothetical protein
MRVVRNGEVEPTLKKAKPRRWSSAGRPRPTGTPRWSRASTMIRHNTATVVRSLSGA